MNSIRNLTKLQTDRAGFTLVELLVVISILSTLAGMFTIAYRGAQQESNTQKTRLTIQKINDVLLSRLQEYESYPVPLSIPASAVPTTGNIGQKPGLIERARLQMLREIIRTEMPDHPDDIKATVFWNSAPNVSPPVIIRPNFTGLMVGAIPVTVPASNVFPSGLTSRAASLYARLIAVPQWDAQFANAELLYLIVEDSEMNGSSAIELFGASEIADRDNDGLKEFVDAFGRPIQWIRWPTGFPQVARSYPDMLNPNIIDSTGNLVIEGEPFDRLKADPGWQASSPDLRPGVYPFPLVVSAGLDGFFGLNFREYNRYQPPPITPNWPVAAPTSYSTSDLVFPEPIFGAPSRFSDPWGPRNRPEMRMGALLSVALDPREGGTSAPPTDPAKVASDNLTNYEGAAASL
jgi:prepilin-type N-terminal cleavage/methylation domain-containing protein